MGPSTEGRDNCDWKEYHKRVCSSCPWTVSHKNRFYADLRWLTMSRLVSVARGEQDYFSPEGIPTATEGCKSNALMRCCKDLGVASELWDPRYIRTFMKEKAKQVWVEHVPTKKKKQIWLRKDDEVRYPFKESKFGA